MFSKLAFGLKAGLNSYDIDFNKLNIYDRDGSIYWLCCRQQISTTNRSGDILQYSTDII